MLEQGKITQEEYDTAKAEELVFQRDAAYAGIHPTYSYFVDHVIEEVISDLMEQKGYTYEFAQRMVNGGGYRIYTTVNEQMQNYVEEFYSDAANFPRPC
jgi:penicillin-binding protein 1A